MSNLAALENYCADTLDLEDTVNSAVWLPKLDEPDQPVMNGVFDQGDRVAIVAQSKAKKSFLALQLAVCAATGRDFLGFKIERQKVLMVNGEVKPSKYKYRLKGVTGKLGIPWAETASLEFLHTRPLDASKVTLESILVMCRRLEVTLCILDPFYTFIQNEIDQEQVKAAILQMKQFSQYGITLVSVFHATKGLIGDRQTIDRIAGSGVFARDVDALLSMSVHENKTSVVLSFATRNYAEPETRTIDFDEGAFLDSDLAPVELTSRSRPRRSFDLQSVAACITGPMNASEARDVVIKTLSCGREKAQKLLSECFTEGLISKEPRGKNVFYSPPSSSTDITRLRLTHTNQSK
jgi:hypothetical protein